MTTAELVSGLVLEIKKATERIRFPTEYADEPSDYVKVNVFEQYLPADLFEQTSYYPCVVVEWLETHDTLNSGSLMTVGLTMGVYAKEADGYLDAFHLMETIRAHLLSQRVIANRFRLKGELTWEQPSEQPTPFFFVVAELTYNALLTPEILKR